MSVCEFQIETAPWPEFGQTDRQAWDRMRASRSSLSSPFFTTSWCDAVHAARGDLMFARLTQQGEAVGFLPFHRGSLGRIRPAGGPLSDFHGLICEATLVVDARALMTALDAGALRLECAPSDDPLLGGQPLTAVDCASIDLSDGYLAYAERQRRAVPKAFRNLRARSRRLIAEHRDVEFRLDDRDPAALEDVIRMKRDQYRRTGQIDAFGPSWTRALARNLFLAPRDGARGRLSTLWVDGRLAAGHFGLEATGVLHYWFPVYSGALAHLSPGILLLHSIAEAVSKDGVRRIDLGSGSYPFKKEASDLTLPAQAILLSGGGLAGGASRAVHAATRHCARWPIGQLAHFPDRVGRRLDRLSSFYEPVARRF